jgi:hypothetical protein
MWFLVANKRCQKVKPACTGISKIILAKGSHGLKNDRLNLFRVTISSERTIGMDWPTSTFFMSHRVSFAKHTNTICKTWIKIFGITAVWGKIKIKIV